MALSIVYLGLILVSNSLFLSNYLITRAIRLSVDAHSRLSGNKPNDDSEKEVISTLDKISSSKLLLVLVGPLYLPFVAMKERFQKKDPNQESTKSDPSACGTKELIFAWCFGMLGKQKLEERKIPNWKPLPYKLGALSTTGLIILFSILFSEKVLNSTLGLDPAGTNPKSGFCTNDKMEDKLDGIRERLLQKTNFDVALGQLNFMKRFRNALQEDTALYGTVNGTANNYTCKLDPKTREEFYDNPKHGFGKERGTRFFPGQCESAQKLALDAVRTQTCDLKKCFDFEVVDVENITAVNGNITGLGGIGFKCKTDPCIEVGLGKEIGFGTIFDAAIGKEQNIDVLDKVELFGTGGVGNEAAIPSWGMINQTECPKIPVPCPDFSKYDELSNIVKDYAQMQLQNALSQTVKVASPTVGLIKAEVSEKYTEFLKLLLKQLEIASFIYVGYVCLTLFFPSPMIVFKPSYTIQLRQLLFGAQKYTFMLTAVALFWGVQYFQAFEIFSTFEGYMKVYIQDPCVGNNDYVQDFGGNFSVLCSNLIEMEANWTIENMTIHNIVQMIPDFEQCCAPYPYVNLGNVMPGSTTGDKKEMSEYGFYFDATGGGICDKDCFLLDPEATFAGNLTTCEDNTYVRREILMLNESSDVSWWKIWISTGLLASILLKAGVAKFGIGLVQLADPFMVCDGKYIGPPSTSFEDNDEMKAVLKKKEYLLRITSFGTVFKSGFLMNLMMLNIILAGGPEEGIEGRDAAIGSFLIIVSLVPVAISFYASRLVTRKLLLLETATKNETGEEEHLGSGVGRRMLSEPDREKNVLASGGGVECW